MSNALAITTEFTIIRTVGKVGRELTETNLLFSGRKAERIQVGEAKIIDQWNNGYFTSLMATFAGALGPIVTEKLSEAAERMNDAELLNGRAGAHDAARPNRVMVALTLGMIVKALEAKAAKTKSGVMRGEVLRFHGIATDLTAKYAAAAAERAAKVTAPALQG